MLRRLLNRCRTWLVNRRMDAILAVQEGAAGPLVRIGSWYGGWYAPESLLGPDSVCYCAGAGEDITFDVGVAVRFGCAVHIVDPTPRAKAHFEGLRQAVAAGRHMRVNDFDEFYTLSPEQLKLLHFHDCGLWSSDGVQRFHAPKNPEHVSHSIMNLQQTDACFEARCCTLDGLMASLGHDRIDMLKIDIEGAEHEVIAAMLKAGVTPTFLNVEFDEGYHQLDSGWLDRIARTVEKLRQAGYIAVMRDGWNAAFYREASA